MNLPPVGADSENRGPVFRAQLEVMVLLIQDTLSGSEAWAPEVVRALGEERRGLLREQGRRLAEWTGKGDDEDPVASALRTQVGMDPSDATLVAWCFAAESARDGYRADPRGLLLRVGAAYLSLFRGPHAFAPSRRMGDCELLPLAVAAAAFRLARARGDASSEEVEPVVRRTVHVLTEAGGETRA